MFEVIFLLIAYFLAKRIFYILGAILVIVGIVFGIICAVKSSKVRKLSKKTFIVSVSALVIGAFCIFAVPVIKNQISYAKIAKIGPRVDMASDSDEFEYNGVTYVSELFLKPDGVPSDGEFRFVLYYPDIDSSFKVFEVKNDRGYVIYKLENANVFYVPKYSHNEIRDYYLDSAPMIYYAAVYDQGDFKSRDEYEKDGSFDFKRIETDRDLFNRIDYYYKDLVRFDLTDDVKEYYIYGHTADKLYTSRKVRVAVVGDTLLWDFYENRQYHFIEGNILKPEDEQQLREALKKVYG